MNESTNPMTLEEKIGQMLCVGGSTGGLEGQDVWTLREIEQGRIGGVYLGYPHFRNPSEARERISAFQASAPISLFICFDFETGPGYNIAAEGAHFPYLMGIGAIGDEEIAFQAGQITGRQAAAIGANFLYTPSVDVNVRPDNPIIGIRSFSQKVEMAGRMGAAFIRGCESEGVICSAKHFPGCGDTSEDTHIDFARADMDLARMEQVELPPFQAAIKAGVKAIMTGHPVYPKIDPSGRPATFSKKILTDLLRGRLGYDGIIISDSLAMGAIEKHFGTAEGYTMALEAGCDVLLIAPDPEALPALVRAVQTGRIDPRQIDRSVERILTAKRNLVRKPALSAAALAQDRAFALEVGRRAAQVLKNDGVLPLSPDKARAFVIQWRLEESPVFPREAGVTAALAHELGLRGVDPSRILPLSRHCEAWEADRVAAKIDPTVSQVVFLAIAKNYARDPYRGLLSPSTVRLLKSLVARGIRVVVGILGSPYVLDQVPDVNGFICTYGDTMGSVAGMMENLFAAE